MNHLGTVYLVGAGPGDPELITVRGLNCLRRAEIVVHDRLVNPELLHEAPQWTELIDVGKVPGQHRWQQDQINAVLIRGAQLGKTVVRLKGGDPFVFGRGGEECQALAEAGVPFQVVPGVSSAVAAPTFAGIPVTHRNVAQFFTVVTGHTSGANSLGIDWDALPRKGTLVILMGMSNLAKISQQLIEYGRPSKTPVAVIQWATVPDQTVVVGTLENIAQQAQGIDSPATIVVGEVVNLSSNMAWFRPDQGGIPAAFTPAIEPLFTKDATSQRKLVR